MQILGGKRCGAGIEQRECAEEHRRVCVCPNDTLQAGYSAAVLQLGIVVLGLGYQYGDI